ncbi:MAG: hypothetical protein HY369_01435 [Candidatus Aenigmarchaeota archaeon]|nr:hypothetical protein [Candidatus Aenigmarchaeota archaeon]
MHSLSLRAAVSMSAVLVLLVTIIGSALYTTGIVTDPDLALIAVAAFSGTLSAILWLAAPIADSGMRMALVFAASLMLSFLLPLIVLPLGQHAAMLAVFCIFPCALDHLVVGMIMRLYLRRNAQS